MKGGTLQITWHGSDPVLTLDFHISSGLLATGGADHDIKLWTVGQGGESQTLPTATFETSLSYHTAAVNVLRFSPTGDHLASGADGGELLIWRLVESSESVNTWKVSKTLRFHLKDVLDLEWSPDSTSLVSGSVDNSVIIWDITRGIPQQVLKDHLHYVQGVAWDPARQYVASISGDRTCRIYSKRNSKSKAQDKNTFVCQNVLVKAEMQKKDEDDTLVAKAIASKHYLFHDETLPSFFRRLAWSPDGSFLLVPSGIHRFSAESALLNTTYIVSRKDLSRPVLQLPGANKPIVAVRFCPLFFTLRPMTQKSESDSSVSDIFKLPYRLVFAVASLNSLFIYDTQNACPLAIFAGLHYAAITDIAWAWDAKFLAVSSQDGFCTLVAFDDGDLGSPLPWTEIPSHIASYLPDIQLAKTKKVIGETQGEVSQTSGEERLISMSSTAKQEVGNDVTAISVELIKPEEDEKFLNACEETVPTPSTADSIRSVLEIEKPAETRPLKIRRIIPTAISAETVLSSEGLGAKHITTSK